MSDAVVGGTVYALVNRLTFRMYIGATSRCICARFVEHVRMARCKTRRCTYEEMHRDGPENLCVVRLASVLDWHYSGELERLMIDDWGLTNPINGYNRDTYVSMTTARPALSKVPCACDKLRASSRLFDTLEEAVYS